MNATQPRWNVSTVADVARLEMGQSPDGQATNTNGKGTPLIGGAADYDDRGIEASRYTTQPTKICREGDLILCIRATIGKVAVADKAYCLGRGVAGLRPSKVTSDFLRHFLNSQAKAMDEAGTGTTFRQIDKKTLSSWPIPLPEPKEQDRIVAKLDSLLERSKNARKELARISGLVERYKQAVLESAFNGRLTAHMREDHAETCIDSIPKTWTWSRLGDLCEAIVDCPHSTPEWTEHGEICIRTTNFKPGMLDLTKVRYVSWETYHKRNARLTPQVGDVVYSREGGILGIACQIPDRVKLCLGQRMMLMRSNPSSYSSALLMYFLNSPSTLATVRKMTGGTASPHLNIGDVKNFRVPVPPLEEQVQIVTIIQRLFTAADKTELHRKKAANLIDRLDEATLAKAFRGELRV
jgi:type I restriction enzyme S subunit